MKDILQNNILFIIGNGFDLYHSLPTGYEDFAKYLKKNNGSLYYNLETYFDGNTWSDFENSLGTFSLNKFINDNDELIPDENNERDFAKYQLADSANNFQDQMKNDLPNELNNWILAIDYSKIKPMFSDCIINQNYFYISFNYSSTLEKLYLIRPENICYIHGKAREIKKPRCKHDLYDPDHPDIITGHGNENYTIKTIKTTIKKGIEAIISQEEALEELKSYPKISLKKLSFEHMSFLDKKPIKKIIVFGHSFGKVDIPYFQDILEKYKDASWLITYYEDKDKSNIEKKCNEIGIKNFKLLYNGEDEEELNDVEKNIKQFIKCH